MRRVQTNSNHSLLKSYYDKILVPFFEIIVALKSKVEGRVFSFNVNDIKGLKLLPADFPFEIFETKNDEVELGKEIEELYSSCTLDQIKKQQKNFIDQNEQLFNGFIPRKYPRNEKLYRIFSKIFYEKLFDSNICWQYLQKTTYNRTNFYNNFLETNKTVCPLCDIDTINSKSNSVCEHFLPRNEFPYLSMNPYNLIPTCNACNKAEEGKGSEIFLPINTPYMDEFGSQISFDIANSAGIFIDFKVPNVEKLENFNKTLKLAVRYQKPNVAHSAIQKLERDKRILDRLIAFGDSRENALQSMLQGLDDDVYYYFRKFILNATYN